MSFDPGNPDIIYAGTGEGFFNADGVRGEGIFKTTNAGATWVRLASTLNANFQYVNKLEYDGSTGTLWAATRTGLFKSTDNGSSFNIVVNSSNCLDLEIANTNPTTIYASFGRVRNRNSKGQQMPVLTGLLFIPKMILQG